MATAQSIYLQIIRQVSPYSKNDVEITSANLATETPDAMTKAEILDYYNRARRALVGALLSMGSLELVRELIIRDYSDLTFTADAAPKPADYFEFVSARNFTTSTVADKRPASDYGVVASGRNPKLTPSVSRNFVFDIGSSIVYLPAPGTDAIRLAYVELKDFNLATDIYGGTVVELIHSRFHTNLVELAVAAATGAGAREINALAARLVGGSQ